MSEQLADGVWVLALDTPTLPPATATNTLVIAGDRVLIIEPATPHARERARLDALLERLHSEGRALAGIVITHHHGDHIGYAEALRERHGIPIHAHPETTTRVPFTVDEPIDEGWQIDLGDGHVVEALYTPGHAPGHLVLWDRKTDVAHAGDLFAGTGTILIDIDDGGDMRVYLDSLRRMAARVRAHSHDEHRPALVPAHGPVQRDPAALLDHYVAHRLAREAKVRAALEQHGPDDFDAVLASAYADTPKHIWPIAALSLRAHLHKLAADGEL